MNSIAFIAFTRRGCALATRLVAEIAEVSGFEKASACAYGPARFAENPSGDLAEWTARHFAQDDALVFVGATGIAVRAIAPHVADKFTDPAVVCIDEAGRVAVPLLSGHVGGANGLARALAGITGGQAAISTATDVNGTFAVDEWAARNDLQVVERDLAKAISARLLEGGTVGYDMQEGTQEGTDPFCTCKKGLSLLARLGGEGCPEDLGFIVDTGTEWAPFERTLHLVPRAVTVGVGCRKGVAPAMLVQAVDAALAKAGVSPLAVRAVATIDVKRGEPAVEQLAADRAWELRYYPAEALREVPGEFDGSAFVEQTVGVDNVCERAALAEGGVLLLGKQAADGVTVALGTATATGLDASARFGVAATAGRDRGSGTLARFGRELTARSAEAATPKRAEVPDPLSRPAVSPLPKRAEVPDPMVHPEPLSRLDVVGLGPGGGLDLTGRARAALDDCDVIVGYPVYVDLVRDEFQDKEVITTPMRQEVERCRMALEQAAAGKRVALVCSGDPGVYGMAGLVLELAAGYPGVDVQVVPGVSAANGGAAILGAPLVHDWCVISLSDLLTPWEDIERRLAAAARADFAIVLYNPASRKRPGHLRRACDVLLEHKDAGCVCGIVRNIGRAGQDSRVLTLVELRDTPVDMFTTVFIGNSQTGNIDGRMVTPRGYRVEER